MTPSRLAKSLTRRLSIMWREQPTQHDIEELADNTRRVGMIIRFRWALVVALTTFSVVAAGVYSTEVPLADLAAKMAIPAAALVFVLGYNLFYQRTYRRLGHVTILNHAQLLLDVLVITVLIHYSGGVYSWFYTMYPLLVFEAAFIFRREVNVWVVTAACMTSYALVVGSEFVGAMPHVLMPFGQTGLQTNAAYVALRLLWAVALVMGTASISLLMMEDVRRRERELREATIVDETTGLSNRSHFHYALDVELQRAHAGCGQVAVALFDIDRFGEFNRSFGIDAGNRMLFEVAALLDQEARASDEAPASSLNTVARYGGEEFGVVLPAGPSCADGTPNAELAALALAERVRDVIGRHRVNDTSVTVSVGVAVSPWDGSTASELLSAADAAVASAAAAGGNRVVAAGPR